MKDEREKCGNGNKWERIRIWLMNFGRKVNEDIFHKGQSNDVGTYSLDSQPVPNANTNILHQN